jgi:hypothetical protein
MPDWWANDRPIDFLFRFTCSTLSVETLSALFAEITYGKIIGTFTGPFLGIILVFGERRAPSSGIISSYGVFDLDNIRSRYADKSARGVGKFAGRY